MKVRASRSGIPSLSTMYVVGMELRSVQVVAGGLDPPSQIVTVQLVFKVQCTVNSHISPLGFFSAML